MTRDADFIVKIIERKLSTATEVYRREIRRSGRLQAGAKVKCLQDLLSSIEVLTSADEST